MMQCRKTLGLAGGDFAMLFLFAAIGRGSHGKSLDAASILITAAPFLIGKDNLESNCGIKVQVGNNVLLICCVATTMILQS